MSKQAITSGKLIELKTQYEKNKSKILKDDLQLSDTLPTFEIFDRTSLEKILALEGCVGVRMYYGMNEKMEMQLMAVGVDKDGKDIQSATYSEENNKGDDSIIAFTSVLRCPPDCPTDPPPPPPNEP